MASRWSSATRSACWRKSGVVSITMFWPPREIKTEGRSLLSCGSADLHTRQGQPSVGTPMEVPEPRTVTFSGAGGMVKALKSIVNQSGLMRPGCCLGAALGFGFSSFGRNRLIDLQIRHLQFTQQIQEQSIFFGREIAIGLLVQSVEHVNQLARGLGIDHGLAGAWVSVGAKDHGGVASEHADEILEGSDALRSFRGRGRSNRFGLLGRRGGNLRRLALGFPLFFLDDFLAQFPFGGEGAAVDYAKCFFRFVVGHSTFLSDLYHLQFITGCQPGSLRRGPW